VYINDLQSRVKGTVRLFADDCLLYRTIKSTDNTASLQKDFDITKKKLTMMFCIPHTLDSSVAINQSPLQHLIGAATRGHQQRYRVPYCRTLAYKESFFPLTIRLWNAQPDNINAADSLETFRTRIQEYKPIQP
jgi:hypothetical protein